MRLTADDAGFALPITLFLVTILTVMLASQFTRAASDHQVSGSSKATIDALSVAQAGLNSYLSHDFSSSNRPVAADSMRFNVPGGYAWVVPEVAQTPADTMTNFRYLIRSTGYVVEPSMGPTPQATRTVAQFADWQTPWLNAPSAAIIAANGLDIESEDVVIDGRDRTNPLCVGDPLLPDGFGARLPAGANSDLDDAVFRGSPPLLELGTELSVAMLTNIDWGSILSGGVTPDFWNPQNWGSENNLPGDFPIQMVVGDYSEQADHFFGEGLLIVTGELEVRRSRHEWYWRGVILVGGEASIESDEVYIYGTLITGLFDPTPDQYDDTDIRGDDDVLIRFDSCNIRKSLQFLKGFVPLENTLVDNWATY